MKVSTLRILLIKLEYNFLIIITTTYTTTYPFLRIWAIRRSLFGRSLCSVRLFQSVAGRKIRLPPFHSHFTAQKNKEAKNRQPYFFCCSFLIFTRSLPCVRWGYCIHNTTSFRYTPHIQAHAYLVSLHLENKDKITIIDPTALIYSCSPTLLHI